MSLVRCRRAGGNSTVFSSAWCQNQTAIPVWGSVPTATAPTSFRGIYHVSFDGELSTFLNTQMPKLVLVLLLFKMHGMTASGTCTSLLCWCQLLLLSFSPILLGVLICIPSSLFRLFCHKGPIHDPQRGRRATQTRQKATFAGGAVVGGGDPADDGGGHGHLR